MKKRNSICYREDAWKMFGRAMEQRFLAARDENTFHTPTSEMF